ncbi:hypothetical protein SDC9_79495 [bioreactor metagenome]|uniref:Uncharacterized protein n=1 Tax=bioreactor metagenome TaxID=1076179 RepID=A0A644YY29_9ZZZZ|nr:hypothetical protein [Oscillibacter sp.]MEA4994708.1 hypothetical protein [Oscillibacter sp.]
MARTVRTLEERIAILDEKISKKKTEIAKLESQKYALEHPVTIKDLVMKAKQSGMSPNEIAQKLGIDID